MSGLTVRQPGESIFPTIITTEGLSASGSVITKMKVFGHHPVTDYDEAILFEGALQDAQEQVTARSRFAPGVSDESRVWTCGLVNVVPAIPALQAPRYASKVSAADGTCL
jgi:hypothetical protein